MYFFLHWPRAHYMTFFDSSLEVYIKRVQNFVSVFEKYCNCVKDYAS